MEILHAPRAYEDVYFEDPSENPETPHFRVCLDDESVGAMLSKVSSAIDRAQEIEGKMAAARSDVERAEATGMLVHLQKRVIVAVIGEEGYDELLAWMGGGDPVDPARHTRQIGEVFAALLTIVGRRATGEQLRACGLYFMGEREKSARLVQGKAHATKGGKKHR